MTARSRRTLAVLFASLAALLLACRAGEGERSEAEQATAADAAAVLAEAAHPNLLLVTFDTTRADALGAYGQVRPASPNIDRLAASGVLFEHVSASNPETLPSHVTIFTGRWPWSHGVRANAGYVLTDDQRTLAEVLADHGYRTGAEVAAPVLRPESGAIQGFEHYRGAESPDVTLEKVHYRDDIGELRDQTREMRVASDIGSRGREFLREHAGEPFFLWLHFFDPHNPYSPPPRFRDEIPDSPYHAEIASADLQVGLVLRTLDELGLRDRTLVVLTADHGEGLGDHGEPSHSFFVYDSVMRVPLVLAGLPELPAGRRIASLVRTVDVAPTVLELLGLPPLESADGRSLIPLIRGQDLDLEAYGEATRFASSFGMPILRFLRRGRWKYIHHVKPELYDLQTDPGELHDLAAEQPDRVRSMRAELERLLATAPAPREGAETRIDSETAARLRALGYATSLPVRRATDEGESLALYGRDPATMARDVQLVSEGMGLLSRGDFHHALERLRELQSRNPDAPFVLDLVAQARDGLGHHDDAIRLWQRAASLDPENTEIGMALARALAASGDPEAASDRLRRVLASDACHETARIELNRLLRETSRFQDLLELLASGAERCPDQLPNLNNYAWALATLPVPELRDGSRALGVIESAMEQAPAEEAAYLDTRAAALAETGDLEGAVQQSLRALEMLRSSGGPREAIAEVEAHLESYRAGRPVRDPSPAGSPAS